MNLKEISKIKAELAELLKDKSLQDAVIFGSFAKGKPDYKDIDVLIISDKKTEKDIRGFHLTCMTPDELLTKFPLMLNTLLREGYSLKHNQKFSEYFRFKSEVLFFYELTSLKASEKVKIANCLHGKANSKGLVEENSGRWISRQVFAVPPESSSIFEKIFLNFNIKFQKSYILTH